MPSVGAARNSAAPCLSESSMGVSEDTVSQILSNTYGFRVEARTGRVPARRHSSGPGGHVRFFTVCQLRSCQPESSCYYLVLRRPDPAGECSAGLTFLCQQCDIAPSFSRLLGISSRATVRRNAGEPFLLVRSRPRAATPVKNSYRPLRGWPVSGLRPANRQEAEE